MAEHFESLKTFDDAAKAQERDRFFQARLQIEDFQIQKVKVLFERGCGKSLLSDKNRQQIYERETEEPEWTLSSPELKGLTMLISKLIPDPQRVFIMVAELRAASWIIMYGPDLTFSHSGGDLALLVAQSTASIINDTAKADHHCRLKTMTPDYEGEYAPERKAAIIDVILNSTVFIRDILKDRSPETRNKMIDAVTTRITSSNPETVLQDVFEIYRKITPGFSKTLQKAEENDPSFLAQVITILKDQYGAKLRIIDKTLLNLLTSNWEKASVIIDRVVFHLGIMDDFYQDRLIYFVEHNKIELQGDVTDFHSCKLRITSID